jgi:putative membrane protein
MLWTASQIAVCSIGIVHAGFMIGELYPWESPWIMVLVLQKWPDQLDLSDADRHFASMVVHNAGIYNGIVAAGLFATASAGPAAFHVQVALLTGGIVAGLFGFATLTKKTIMQAVLGAIALVIVVWDHM